MAIEIEGKPPIHYDAVVSLRISTQSIEPEAVTVALGLEPETSWHRGDTTRRLGNGRLVPRRAAANHYWVKSLAKFTSPPDDLPLELGKLLDQLESARDFFDAIRSEGGRAEFFIGYFMRKSNTGDTFEPSLLARLAELGIG